MNHKWRCRLPQTIVGYCLSCHGILFFFFSRGFNRNSVRQCCRHRRDEPVSTLGKRLYEDRIFGGIPERGAQTLQGGVETAVEFHVSVGGPEFLAQFLARHDLAVALQKNGEETERQVLQADAHSLAQEFAIRQIDLEQAKTITSLGIGRRVHPRFSVRARPLLARKHSTNRATQVMRFSTRMKTGWLAGHGAITTKSFDES